MLRQKALKEVLSQVNSSEIEGSLLFNKDGILLSFSGYSDSKSNPNVSAALISSIWESFDRKGTTNDLREAIIQCEDGMLACTKVSNMILAVKASKDAQLGLVRAKLHALAKYLDGPLTVVSRNT